MKQQLKSRIENFARVPSFWHKEVAEKSMWPDLLVPFSVIYYSIFLLKQKLAKPQKIEGAKIICIGNVTAGGAGKTPVAIALVEELKKVTSKKACFSSRGYMGSVIGPLKVDPAVHTAEQVGDEPLLLAKALPCWVGKRRYDTARAAVADGAEIIIMDDGMQNLTVQKDLNILVVDGYFGIGNSFAIPAGPLREPLEKALEKATVAVFIGEDRNNILFQIKNKIPVIHAKTEVSDRSKIEGLKDKKIIAFSGISIPDKFFHTLEKEGLKVIEKLYFADHYNFTNEDIDDLFKLSDELAAELVTTEKDAIRLPERARERVTVIPVTTKFDKPEEISALLQKIL